MQPTTQEPAFLSSDTMFDTAYRFALKFFSVNWLGVMYVVLSLLVIALITVALYALVRLYEMQQEDKKKEKLLAPSLVPPGAAGGPSAIDTLAHAPKVNETWRSIRERLLSDNPTEWRLAIIEADIYMDRLFDNKGFHGDTIGDKLKQIEPSQFGAVQIAWEAHKVRNRIAHDGDYALTMPEARRVLSYYEIVFRDLEVID